MRFIHLAAIVCGALLAAPFIPGRAQAQDNALVLSVPAELAESGLWQYILPRFALKTRVRVTLGDDAGALRLGADETGPVALQVDDTFLSLAPPQGVAAEKFADWLTSEVGRTTIDSYTEAAGDPAFTAPDPTAVRRVEVVYEGDPVAGKDLSFTHCGRCHVIDDSNRWNGLGSTPSFGVLRAMPDWPSRFESFFTLAPHGAFTQIAGITAPFAVNRPPPIVPVEITLDDLEAILAFVQQVVLPADLGAPIRHQ